MCLKSAFDIEIVDSYNVFKKDPKPFIIPLSSKVDQTSQNARTKDQEIDSTTEINTILNNCEEYRCCDDPQYIDDISRGETVCKNCGCVVVDRHIDSGKDWRSFTKDDEDIRCRTGSPMNPFIYDGGMSTRIGGGKNDYMKGSLDSRSEARDRRLRKWNNRWMNQGREYKNFADAMDYLKKYSNIFEIPKNVQKEIAHLYKKSIQNACMKHKTIRSTILAFIYIMCQKHKIPKDVEEITTSGCISKKEFNRYRHRVMRILNIRAEPAKPEDYIVRIFENLKIDDYSILNIAKRILEKVRSQGDAALRYTNGKDPSGLAAAAIYLTCILKKYRRTQQQISEVANVTEVTLRQRYHGLCKILGFPPDALRGDNKTD